MKYVDESSLQIAGELESMLATLPPQAGVLFAAVHAQPEEGGKAKNFKVFVGVSKKASAGAMGPVVRQLFSEYIRLGFGIDTVSVVGREGAGREEDPSNARPASA